MGQISEAWGEEKINQFGQEILGYNDGRDKMIWLIPKEVKNGNAVGRCVALS